MADPQYDDILRQLKAMTEGVPQEALDLELNLTAQTLRLIAEGQPVSVERLARAWGFPLEQAQQIIDGAQDKLEIDQAGNLVGGSGLSQRETAYRIQIGDRVLYAWCGMDVLFLAGFLGEPITAETQDPVTGESITLTIGPDGLHSYSPESLSLSVYLPGEDGAYDKAGADSVVCLNMPFFASPQSAADWIAARPSNRLLPITDAYQLVRNLWLDRLDQIEAQESP